MEYKIEGRSVVTLNHTKGDNSSTHVQTDINLQVSKNLDSSQYLGEDGLPTKDGTKMLTQAFVQGLVGNIHHAQKMGYWNDAEHIRYIISELEKGFVTVANTFPSTFD